MEEETVSVWPDVEDYIKFAESLKSRCSSLENVQGADKLARKIGAEIKFLYSLRKHPTKVQSSHLQSSNLCHFASIVHAAERVPGVVHVLKPFRHADRSNNLVVDIVGARGHLWVKVIARKAQALHLVWAGQGQFGERDILSQAEEYVECSKTHPIDYACPKVHYAFYNQVTQPLATALTQKGIHVWGTQVAICPNVQVKLNSVVHDDDDEDDDSLDDSENSFDDDLDLNDKEDDEDNKDDDDEFDDEVDGVLNFHRLTTIDCSSLPHKSLSGSKDTDLALPNVEYKHDQDPCINIGESCQNVSENSDPSPFHGHLRASSGDNSNVPGEDLVQSIATHAKTFTSDNLSTNSSNSEASHSSAKASMPTTVFPNTTTDRTSQNLPSAQTFPFPKNHESSENTGEMSSPSSTASSGPDASFQALFGHIAVGAPQFEETMGGSVILPHLSPPTDDGRRPPIKRANLDITTLITLVSNVTHGFCHCVFRDKVLALQAREEQQAPVLPGLSAFLEGKELFVCQTALSSFQAILDIMGGAREKQRAADLLDIVTTVQDQPSDRAKSLPCQGKIKDRSKIVFGTGDSLQAVTVTSNSGFIRAASDKGIVFSTYLHPARALTEQKEAGEAQTAKDA